MAGPRLYTPPPARACGGIGRRARLRALWAEWPVGVRVSLGALKKVPRRRRNGVLRRPLPRALLRGGAELRPHGLLRLPRAILAVHDDRDRERLALGQQLLSDRGQLEAN